MTQPSAESRQEAEQLLDEPDFRLEKDGLLLDGFSESQARVMENMDSPLATFGLPLTRSIWKSLSRRFRDLAGSTQVEGMRKRYEVCQHVCRSMPKDSTVADSLLVIFDLRERARLAGKTYTYLDGTIPRLMREVTYKWIMSEFAGRQTG